ncbi:MAG: flagellar hook basal-body protein [Alphaproteobacteria bacterium]|nr:flagellar hook basal-body protein [Alphaproteobacteria bacterium]
MAISSVTPSGTIENAGVVLLSAKELLIQQINIEAQNLSNADTVGFKGLIQGGLESVYSDPRLGGKSPSISYVQGDIVKRDLSQGALKQTGNVYDFALNGSGYFMVQSGDAKLYTRDGRFRLDKNGTLTAFDGSIVQGEDGDINLGKFVQFSVSRDGTIVGFDAAGAQTVAGKLKIAVFKDEQNDLEYIGMGRFLAHGEEIPMDANTQVMNGFLEQANVNPISGSIKLMRIMQMYEEAQRVTEMQDATLSKTINLRITS